MFTYLYTETQIVRLSLMWHRLEKIGASSCNSPVGRTCATRACCLPTALLAPQCLQGDVDLCTEVHAWYFWLEYSLACSILASTFRYIGFCGRYLNTPVCLGSVLSCQSLCNVVGNLRQCSPHLSW